MEQDYSNCIQMYSGVLVNLANPDPNTLLLPDIAHHLSCINRFTGASRKPYSVAQHSCLVSKLIPDNIGKLNKLRGLFHDSSEAFLGDVSSPLKKLLPEYRVIEDNFQKIIIKRFNLGPEDNFDDLKFFDLLAMEIESKALVTPRHKAWERYKPEFPQEYELDWELLSVKTLTPEEAEKEFLETFNKLWLERYL